MGGKYVQSPACLLCSTCDTMESVNEDQQCLRADFGRAAYLLSPTGVAVHFGQSIFVDKADLVWRNADDGTVLLVQVQDVLMPSTERVSPRSPKLCEPSCCRSGNVTQRIQTKSVDDLSENDVSENHNSAFPSDVMQE
jgi:hypothetical protein